MIKKRAFKKNLQLSDIGESGLIKKFRTGCRPISSDVITGIGDDSAIIKSGIGQTLVTSDMMIEGVHFDLSFTTFFQLGYKFLSVNLSDIYAMGGRPKYFLVSIGIPDGFSSKSIDDLYSGIMNKAKKIKVQVVGGDTCSSRKGLVLSGTMIGYSDKPIKRSGAGPGEGIFVTDTLGDSAMGLEILKKRKKRVLKFTPLNARMRLMKRHLMPHPLPLKSRAKITSMIDISDGLLKDLGHICDESRTGAEIYQKRLPLSKDTLSLATETGSNPYNYALKGGEDYVLLFTAPKNLKTDAFMIGEITRKGRFIVDEKGEKRTFKPEGYEHFK